MSVVLVRQLEVGVELTITPGNDTASLKTPLYTPNMTI